MRRVFGNQLVAEERHNGGLALLDNRPQLGQSGPLNTASFRVTLMATSDGIVCAAAYSRRAETFDALSEVCESAQDRLTATPDMAVLLGNHKSWLYDQGTVREQILPRLEAAQPVPAARMRRLLMRLQRPQGLAFMLVIVALAAVAALHLLR